MSNVSHSPKTTIMIPVQANSPKGSIDATVGQTVKTAQGNVITVYQFQSPAQYAEAGFVIAAADVGACASSSTTVVTQGPGVVVHAGVSPQFFSVQLDDGTIQEAQNPGIKDPALAAKLLQPGECARGWVTFHIPEQRKVAYVLFRSLSVVKWHTN